MSLQERVAILGGADPTDPLEPHNRVRHTAVGWLLICVAAWACVASAAMFHSNLKAPWPLAIMGGLLIAAIIFCIDLLITCTPLREDKTRYRARIILIRGMVSVAMGLVISHATILFMFRDGLAQIVSARNRVVAEADTNRVKANSPWSAAIASAQNQISSDRKQIQAADSSYARAQAELDRSRNAWLDDLLCTHGTRAANGDQCGRGPTSDALRHSYAELNNNFPALRQAHDRTISSLDDDIITLNNTITTDQNKLNTEIRNGIQADLANVGLAAQSEALWALLRKNAFLWLWPIFFIALDLAVALMKGILTESDFDRKRRRERERDDALNDEAKSSPVWRQVAAHVARRQADVAIARADVGADREIAALRTRRETQHHRPRVQHKLAWAGAAVSAAATLAISLTATYEQSPSQPADLALTAVGGQSIRLHGGETLTVPIGAITGNAPATASYTASQVWPGNAPASPEVKFTTTGTIVGKPVLTLQVPASEHQIALTGALHLAFRSPASGDWTPYPAIFNAETDTMVATLAHFSTWRFWTSGWATDFPKITKSISAWHGRHASDAPDCNNGPKPPGWYQADVGMSNAPEPVVRGCVRGHAGGVLDIELVNNRPYGLILKYGSAAVKWAWHARPHTLADALRDAIGDYAAHATGGLYLPPLSRASVGIKDFRNRANNIFTIIPTAGTILGDAIDMSLGSFSHQTTSIATTRWAKGTFDASAQPSCTEAAAGNQTAAMLKQSAIMSLLAKTMPACLSEVHVMIAGNQSLSGRGIGSGVISQLLVPVTEIRNIISTGGWHAIESCLGSVLNFGLDLKYATVPHSGFGFKVLAHHA